MLNNFLNSTFSLYSPEVRKCLAKMMSMPFLFGFSPRRWEASMHMMLEKIKGNPRIDKLRIIQLS